MCNGNCNQGRNCDCRSRCREVEDAVWLRFVVVLLALFAVLLALLYSKTSEAKSSYDERKQAVLSERKAVRRATERAYEPCLRAGNPPAKCLAESLKAGEKALANWRAAGNNPHTFSTY